METPNCVVDLAANCCDIWLGTQAPTWVQKVAAAAAGLRLDQVRVHNQLSGGGFGRRSETDYIAFAVEIARRVGAPVKTMWPREQDIRGGMFRPMIHHPVEVGIYAAGLPTGWSHTISGGYVLAAWASELAAKGLPDTDATEGCGDEVQLQQVVINLVVNATQAMQDAASARRVVSVSSSATEGTVTIGVSDTGPGIEPTQARTIFEAFPTTKSYGMGLGLSIARSIAVRREGGLAFEARSAGGSEFLFTLPEHQQS